MQPRYQEADLDGYDDSVECEDCLGTGDQYPFEDIGGDCPTCGGIGYVER
jgi:DnaJ-class molecular chaperone